MSGEKQPSNSGEQPNPQAEQWDILIDDEIKQYHPREEGESKKEYKKRLKDIKEKTAEYLEADAQGLRPDGSYSPSYQQTINYQKEQEAKAKTAQMVANIDQRLQNGEISQETADRMKARADQYLANEISDIRDNYGDDNALFEDEWVDAPNVMSREQVLKEAKSTDLTDEQAKELESIREKELIAQREKEMAAAKEKEAIKSAEQQEKDSLKDERDRLSDKKEKIDLLRDRDRLQRIKDKVDARRGDDKSGLELELPFEDTEENDIAKKRKLAKKKKKELDKKRPELAEKFARGRRLIDVSGNREKFTEAREEYQELLDEYLRLKTEAAYEEGRNEINKKIERRFAELETEIEQTLARLAQPDANGNSKSPEEIEAKREQLILDASDTLKKEYKELSDALETKINADFAEALLEEKNKLEDATIEKLDKGTICRQIVSKIINNKALKAILVTAGVVGLAVTGAGLVAGAAAGAITFMPGFTLPGVVAGVVKGGASGALMSRQSSKQSAVRGFANEDTIKEGLKGIDTSQGEDITNVAGWLMGQYESAKESDLKSNRKRTAVAAGLGAAIGGIMSGVEVKAGYTDDPNNMIPVGEPEPTTYDFSSVENVYHEAGTGVENFFVNETHLVSSPEEFYRPGGMYDILIQSGAHHGLVEGSNGGWSYPGTLSEWLTTESQETVREALQTAASQGVITPDAVLGGNQNMVPAQKLVDQIIPLPFTNFFTREIPGIATGIVAGAAVNRRANNAPEGPFPTTTATRGESPTVNIVDHGNVDPNAPTEPINRPVSGGTPNATPNGAPNNTPNNTPDGSSDTITEPILVNPIVPPQTPPDASGAASRANQPQQPVSPSVPANAPQSAPEPQNSPAGQSRATSEDLARERILDQHKREEVTAALGNILDAEGIDIVTMAGPVPGDNTNVDAMNTRIRNWWNQLSDDAKEQVRQYERETTISVYGGALRNWLTDNDELEPPTVAYNTAQSQA